MRKLRDVMLCIVILSFVAVVLGCFVYNYKIGPVSNNKDLKEIVIPSGSSTRDIARLLKENNLIRSENFFLFYVKLFDVNNLRASTYLLSEDMGVKRIIDTLQKGNSYNPDSIKITFKEGINMRELAEVISSNTNHSKEDVMSLLENSEYIDTLIDTYWFLTDDIKDSDIYYALEGYLFPSTYEFKNKNVEVEEIFKVMLDEMEEVLSPYKEEIEATGYSIHEVLTLASMVEKEASREIDRGNVASVFYNRLDKKMSLGSDVTTRYALKIDNPKQQLSTEQYQTKNPYNTRYTGGSMNGRLPIGPICTISKSSIEASIRPAKTDYLYFIANVQTKETFFYQNSRDFEAKKQELSSVNGGL